MGEAREENAMDEARIIQIIPAPADMLLKYKEDDGSVSQYRPLCLALVRHSEGADEVCIMAVDVCGMIDFADTAPILGVSIGRKEMWPHERTPYQHLPAYGHLGHW